MMGSCPSMERYRRPWSAEFSKKVRREVKEESGNRCAICGAEGCTIHHIVPWSMGGSNEKHNALCACPDCHKELDQLALKEHIFYPEAVIFVRQRRGLDSE